MSMHFLRLSMLKCQHDTVCLSVFLVLFNLRTYVRLHAVCVTASPVLLALAISLFPAFCVYYIASALYPCAAFHDTLLLTLSRKKTFRGSQSPKQLAELNRVTIPPPPNFAS